MSDRVWGIVKQPVKLNSEQKAKFHQYISNFIQTTEKLSKVIHNITLNRGRVYLKFLFKLSNLSNIHPATKLIDDKYVEYNFARITLYDNDGMDCTADWPRHNLKWYPVHEGTLEDCLKFIESDEGPFPYPISYKMNDQ